MRTVRGHESLLQLRTRTIRGREICGSAHLCWVLKQIRHPSCHQNNRVVYVVKCESKNPPEVLWHLFTNRWEFLVQILHAYYAFLSMLEYKFLFSYLQLWRSYAILRATIQVKAVVNPSLTILQLNVAGLRSRETELLKFLWKGWCGLHPRDKTECRCQSSPPNFRVGNWLVRKAGL